MRIEEIERESREDGASGRPESAPEPADAMLNGRRETELERFDRNLVEILQEVRVVQTGVQVLFAFLLSAIFQQRFHILSSFQRVLYFGTLLAAGAAVILLTAPTSHHRILFQRGDKPHLVKVANRLTLIGLLSMGIAMVGVLALVSDLLFSPAVTIAVSACAIIGCALLWYVMPLARRRRLDAERLDAERLDAGASREREPSKKPPGAA